MTRALILGGGGVTGIAWEAGVLQGLAETGFDIRRWDLVVGTSAGSVVGANLLGQADYSTWFERQLLEDTTAEDDIVVALAGRIGGRLIFAGRRRRLGWAPRLWLTATTVETFVRAAARRPSLRGRAPGDAAPPRQIAGPNALLARAAALGVAARTAPEARFISVIANALDPVTDWPVPLTVTAIAMDGSTVAFDAASGVDLARGVAASAAVPLLFPPIVIGGRPYIDGGMGSQTHADVARGIDDVLVVAPLNTGALDRETAALRAAGSRVDVVRPSAAGSRALGRDLALLDPARRAIAARTGREDGLAAGRELVGAWSPGRPSSAA